MFTALWSNEKNTKKIIISPMKKWARGMDNSQKKYK